MKAEDLDVFKLAHQLALKVYKITESFPESERYGLVSQMRRAATSVGSNLMEGAHRFGSKEYRYFISIARGSCGEMKYQLLLAKDLFYVTTGIFEEASEGYERVSMMLTKLHGSVG
jgi:four helix bundle protein